MNNPSQLTKEAFGDKWYQHEQLVVLTKDIGEHKAGRIGRINVVYNTKNRSYIGVHFFGDEPDDTNICSPITQDPPDLVGYCEPIAEDDPRAWHIFGKEPVIARTKNDDAWLMAQLFETVFAGGEAFQQILLYYADKFLSADQCAILRENIQKAYDVGVRDRELFQKACLYFLGEDASLDEFWQFYNGLGIVATNGNPFYQIGVWLGKIPATRPAVERKG